MSQFRSDLRGFAAKMEHISRAGARGRAKRDCAGGEGTTPRELPQVSFLLETELASATILVVLLESLVDGLFEAAQYLRLLRMGRIPNPLIVPDQN